MAAYEYTALSDDGSTRRGVLEGDGPREVRRQLRERNLSPLEVREVKRAEESGGRRGVRVGSADLALFTRQLATLVRAGLPLEEALRTSARQVAQPRLKNLLPAVRAKVLEGHSLAEGLAEFPGVFSDMYQATVSAGEQSGKLDIVLERLADYTEGRRQIRRKTLLALFYPLLLTLVALLVVGGLLAYVVPQVVQVFANVKQELPWLTRTLIHLSDFLRVWGLWLLAGLAGAFLVLHYALRFERPRYAFHRLLLTLPIVGRLERGAGTARFTRTLSILSAGGVPLLEALRISAATLPNLPMRNAVLNAAEQVREGAGLSQSLESSGLFPPLTLQLIATGEAGGRLDEMLERAAQYQEQELEAVIAVLLGLFEPLLILAMGGIVLVIVLAVLMPVFELNQLVR